MRVYYILKETSPDTWTLQSTYAARNPREALDMHVRDSGDHHVNLFAHVFPTYASK